MAQTDKFISRVKRHRSDGTRTSDMITLCFNRVHPDPEYPPEPQDPPKPPKPQNPPAAESAAGRNPAESDATKSGESCLQERREIPGIESINDPLEEPPGNMQGDGANLFQEFWAAWPQDERPRNKGLVEALFLKLSPHERRLAVQYAKAYRANQKAKAAGVPFAVLLREALGLSCKRRHKTAPTVDPKLIREVSRIGVNISHLSRWLNTMTAAGHLANIDAIVVLSHLVAIERALGQLACKPALKT